DGSAAGVGSNRRTVFREISYADDLEHGGKYAVVHSALLHEVVERENGGLQRTYHGDHHDYPGADHGKYREFRFRATQQAHRHDPYQGYAYEFDDHIRAKVCSLWCRKVRPPYP